jgi:antitoxin component of MazEF toxin-antitoxin module
MPWTNHKRGAPMIKKLSKYGNSFALLIDKPILELLNITETTSLRVKTDGNRLIIEPLRKGNDKAATSEDEKLEKLYDSLVKKYGPAFKKLAENS